MRLATIGFILVALATRAAGAESSDPLLATAETLLGQDDRVSAERILRAFHQETPSARSAYLLAVVCVLTGRTEEGERLLDQALVLEPKYGQAWKALGLLYEQQSRFEEAVDAFRRLTTLEPANRWATLKLGKMLASDGQQQEAEQVLKDLVSGNDGESEAVRQASLELGLLHVEKARERYEEGSFEQSLHELESARELLPPSPQLHEFLGLVYWKTRDVAALDHLQIAAEGISSESAWDAYARALAEFGMLDEAVRIFHSKVEQSPSNSLFRTLLGAALWDVTDFEGALEQYRVAAGLAPNSVKAHFLQGSAHRLLGHRAEAKASFERCLEIAPEFRPALFALGRLRAAEGEWEHAAMLLERVRDVDSSIQPVRLELGRVYRRLGRFHDALRELLAAQRLGPGGKQVYYLLGHVYGDLNQPSQAREAFERFASIEESELEARGGARPYLSPGFDSPGLEPTEAPSPIDMRK